MGNRIPTHPVRAGGREQRTPPAPPSVARLFAGELAKQMTRHDKMRAIDYVIDWLETELNRRAYAEARGEVLGKLLAIVRTMRADIDNESRRMLH